MWDKIRPIPTIDGWLDPPEEDMTGHWEVVGTGVLMEAEPDRRTGRPC
jgi:hypothetical protein